MSSLSKRLPCLHQIKIYVSCSAQKTLPTSQTCCWASVLGSGLLPQGWCHKINISYDTIGTGFPWHGGNTGPLGYWMVCLTLCSQGTDMATIYGPLPINKWEFWAQIPLPIWMNNRRHSICGCKGSKVLCWEVVLLSNSIIAPPGTCARVEEVGYIASGASSPWPHGRFAVVKASEVTRCSHCGREVCLSWPCWDCMVVFLVDCWLRDNICRQDWTTSRGGVHTTW